MFEIRQCTHPDCGLRLPVDLAVHRGAYCPRCGAALTQVTGPFQHRYNLSEARPKRRVSVLLDNIRSAHNTGAIFRTADGAGLTHIYLCGITPNPADHPAIQKTSLGAELEITWTAHPDARVLGQKLRDSGHHLLALETTPHAMPLFEVDLAAIEAAPILLIVGNEQAGIDPGLLDLCELVLAVPMVGTKASLNVAVAFGVAAYWLNFS